MKDPNNFKVVTDSCDPEIRRNNEEFRRRAQTDERLGAYMATSMQAIGKATAQLDETMQSIEKLGRLIGCDEQDVHAVITSMAMSITSALLAGTYTVTNSGADRAMRDTVLSDLNRCALGAMRESGRVIADDAVPSHMPESIPSTPLDRRE